MQVKAITVSALEKVFYDEVPKENTNSISLFQNETASFQLAFCVEESDTPVKINVLVECKEKQSIRIRRVCSVPVLMASYGDSDDNYLRKTPGLYPDRLEQLPHVPLLCVPNRWYSLWIDVEAEALEPMELPVKLSLLSEDGTVLAQAKQNVTILKGLLPKQKLVRTQWLHCDSLADFYKLPVFSEEHWKSIENFIALAVKRGINTVLTPIHTPPLDTRVGTERRTVQLVKITKENDSYSFDMSLLYRWIKMCQKLGVEYFEMAHLFTQWGAKHAPKIVAFENGEQKTIFGWNTDAASKEYRRFLEQYISAVKAVLKEMGVKSLWHISDEPTEENLDSYNAAKSQVEDLLKGEIIIDALSDYAFYSKGIVKHPIVANDHIEKFISHNVPKLWTYYCCVQHKHVNNIFIAMPSLRNRSQALLLYKNRIEGLLQWGYNFYYTQYSDYYVNPYASTDADGWVPAGDPFQVYPGDSLKPMESLRLMVAFHAMQDLRAMQWLENIAGFSVVEQLIEKHFGEISFTKIPKDNEAYLSFREELNKEIARRL
ncbi:MAG: DUF4091 domain-containing protein [Eubacteriales bacterium]|nr:DUF4091 domain-containing protein [Eubacteriales bacterium]